MRLKHPFTDIIRELFWDQYSCYLCGRSDLGVEYHHILGRISNRPLNCAPLCPECHSRNHTQSPFTKEEISKLLNKTKKFLETINYILYEKDIEFFEKHKKAYELQNKNTSHKI